MLRFLWRMIRAALYIAVGLIVVVVAIAVIVGDPDESETSTLADRSKETNPPAAEPVPTEVSEESEPAPQPVAYTVKEEKNSSFGNVRSRVTVEIEAPDASTDRERLLVMMSAAADRHRKDWPDAVSARLWNSYDQDSQVRNRIVYAPDGCGWTGDPCDRIVWTDLMHGTVPAYLHAWGVPTDAERKDGRELACRQDLECWGKQHQIDVEVLCTMAVESQARFDVEWTDGFLELKFDRWRWDDRSTGTLAYTGNKVKFQNGFGAWQPVTYWCHFDPASQTARATVHVD